MNTLTTYKQSDTIPILDNKPLETILDDLSKFGNPRLSKLASGWYCSMEMFIQGRGIEFKVASEFGNSTAKQAALVCSERMYMALRDVSDKVLEYRK